MNNKMTELEAKQQLEVGGVLDEKITYSCMYKVNGEPYVSSMWCDSYDTAVEHAQFDQPNYRPYYIVEKVETYAIVGIVGNTNKR